MGRAVLDLENIEATGLREYTLPLMGPRGVHLEHDPSLTLAVSTIVITLLRTRFYDCWIIQ